ncbi:MAG: glycosyltransferase, partial [Planctomycetes bacterium]|nr:glycosyltransferase [Planctomycetota bacterium]
MDYTTAVYIFWISFGILIHTWLGYPVFLFILERMLYRPVKKGEIRPKVSVLVIANNEENNIHNKIENLLGLDYPRALLEIVIASDGSYDRTCDVVRKYDKQGVKLVEFATRRGKPSVLNDVVPHLEGEIVILADTRQRLDKDIIQKLVSNFNDPEVGGVSGELMFEEPGKTGIATGMDTYWRYEKWIRIKESGVDSTIGGTGAIFALRKNLYREIPGETILDDVVLPFQIVRQGFRVVFEKGACAWDVLQHDWQKEFARKARTLAGNFQVLANIIRMGAGLRMFGKIGFEFISHKILRLLGPACLVLMFIATRDILKVTEPGSFVFNLYGTLFCGQVIFYLFALLGALLQGVHFRLPGVSLAYSFVVMQAAILTGFLRFASGRDDVLWEKAHALDPLSGRQKILRLVWDSTLFTAGFVFAYWLRYMGPPPEAVYNSYKQLFPYWDFMGIRFALPIVMFIPMTIFYFFKVNETRTNEVKPEYFLTLIKGIFYSTIALFLLIYLKRSTLMQIEQTESGFQIVSFPTSILLIGFVLNCILIGGWRLLLLWIKSDNKEEQNSFLEYFYLGETNDRDSIDFIQDSFEPKIKLLTINTEAERNNAAEVGEKLRNYLGEVRPNGIIIDPGVMGRNATLEAVSIADERCLNLNMLPGDLELLLGKTHPRLSNYIPLIDISRSSINEFTATIKRLLDLIIGFAIFLAGLPFLALLLISGRLFGPKEKRPQIVWLERIGKKGLGTTIPRLRFIAGRSKWITRHARRAVTGLALITGRLSFVGLRPILKRTYEKMNAMERKFLESKPGVFYLGKIDICRGELLDSRMAAIVYYCRNASPALDLQI